VKAKIHHAPYLRLVPPHVAEPPPKSAASTAPRDAQNEAASGSKPQRPASAGQLPLFSDEGPALLGVIDMARISSSQFIDIVASLKPTMALDLRPLPEFSIGKLTRRSAFSLFEQHQVLYVDVTGRLGVLSRRDARLNSALIVEELGRILQDTPRQRSMGPLLVLVDDVEVATASAQTFPTRLKPSPKGGWQVHLY
jgi:hypothetical protein